MNGDQPNTNNPAPGQVQAPAAADNSHKAEVVEKIKSANSILVAVSADPSIDQLAAAIALTLLLEKYKKNATAVFSGKVPSALEFLKPGKTFQKTTDSLRDFIIAIDKSKADKLRYKVEDDVVKIFITPYKTSITEKDLQYNAGDFNVDVIIALGVQHQQDVDTAIAAHGRIFHDAIVVSLNNVSGGDFGIAHWENIEASSLSELVAELAGDLGQNMLDADIATALLTGIVAETSRFSNAKTHPATMTTSSVLLQAGADQQLVNQQLQAVINNEVKLAAGTEIKPTMSAEQLNQAFPHEAEELVIGSDGSLQTGNHDIPDTDSKPIKEASDAVPPADDTQLTPTKADPVENGSASARLPAEPAPVKPEVAQPELAGESETADPPRPDDHSDREPDLVLPSLTVQEPAKPATPPMSAPADQSDNDPADDPDDAEAARKAVTDALKIAAAEAETIPVGNSLPGPDAAASPTAIAPPAIDPLATAYEALHSEPVLVPQLAPAPVASPVQPTMPTAEPPVVSQAATFTMPPAAQATTANSVPPIGSEPAPLSNSPADQTFTMPMPPPSAFTQAPNTVQAPPPLPPPLPPVQP